MANESHSCCEPKPRPAAPVTNEETDLGALKVDLGGSGVRDADVDSSELKNRVEADMALWERAISVSYSAEDADEQRKTIDQRVKYVQEQAKEALGAYARDLDEVKSRYESKRKELGQMTNDLLSQFRREQGLIREAGERGSAIGALATAKEETWGRVRNVFGGSEYDANAGAKNTAVNRTSDFFREKREQAVTRMRLSELDKDDSNDVIAGFHGTAHGGSGHYEIKVSAFESLIKMDGVENVDANALGEYLAYLKRKGRLDTDHLVKAFGYKELGKLAALWDTNSDEYYENKSDRGRVGDLKEKIRGKKTSSSKALARLREIEETRPAMLGGATADQLFGEANALLRQTLNRSITMEGAVHKAFEHFKDRLPSDLKDPEKFAAKWRELADKAVADGKAKSGMIESILRGMGVKGAVKSEDVAKIAAGAMEDFKARGKASLDNLARAVGAVDADGTPLPDEIRMSQLGIPREELDKNDLLCDLQDSDRYAQLPKYQLRALVFLLPKSTVPAVREAAEKNAKIWKDRDWNARADEMKMCQCKSEEVADGINTGKQAQVDAHVDASVREEQAKEGLAAQSTELSKALEGCPSLKGVAEASQLAENPDLGSQALDYLSSVKNPTPAQRRLRAMLAEYRNAKRDAAETGAAAAAAIETGKRELEARERPAAKRDEEAGKPARGVLERLDALEARNLAGLAQEKDFKEVAPGVRVAEIGEGVRVRVDSSRGKPELSAYSENGNASVKFDLREANRDRMRETMVALDERRLSGFTTPQLEAIVAKWNLTYGYQQRIDLSDGLSGLASGKIELKQLTAMAEVMFFGKETADAQVPMETRVRRLRTTTWFEASSHMKNSPDAGFYRDGELYPERLEKYFRAKKEQSPESELGSIA